MGLSKTHHEKDPSNSLTLINAVRTLMIDHNENAIGEVSLKSYYLFHWGRRGQIRALSYPINLMRKVLARNQLNFAKIPTPIMTRQALMRTLRVYCLRMTRAKQRNLRQLLKVSAFIYYLLVNLWLTVENLLWVLSVLMYLHFYDTCNFYLSV